MESQDWFVYILLCEDGSYYVGMTSNVLERFEMHKNRRGADFTKRFLPVKVLWQERHGSRQSAHQRELQIKGWSRKKKELLISRII